MLDPGSIAVGHYALAKRTSDGWEYEEFSSTDLDGLASLVASNVQNDSGVDGDTVKDGLDALAALITPKANALVTEVVKTDNYTLALADAGKLLTMNNAGAKAFTVPPNADVAFPVGTEIALATIGAGTTSVAAGAGVTIQSLGSLLDLSGQFATAVLVKRATNTWLLSGSLA